MAALLNPALLTIPLLGHPLLRQSTDDPQAWARSVCATTPVQVCEPRQSGLAFRNDAAILRLGEVLVIATQGSAITLSTDQHPSAQLLLPYRGNGLWRIEQTVYENPLGESVLYLPPAPLHLENDITSGVSLTVNPATLLSTAITMAGPEGVPPQRLQVLQQPQRLLLSDPVCARLINGVYAVLFTIDQLTCASGADALALRFDDVLLRALVLLLLPELQQDSPRVSEPVGSLTARRRLEPLLEWIDAHLDQPIGLTDLEAQVHWSRRTLQYTFRSACGCTPMQWLRQRRLHRAMQRLKHPQPGDSVASIGRSVGFVSAVAFSREFRRHFGCTPSSLFRA
jgi:AraC-like DNA-binding protein